MADLLYSREARSVLHKFHSVEIMVFVEGDDDVTFWEIVFNKFDPVPLRIESVGGKGELKKYADDLVDDDANYIVAGDADFSELEEGARNRNLITTYGYSMENSIIFGETIHKATHTLAKVSASDIDLEECKKWLDQFFEDAEELIILDIANELTSAGISIVGKSCDRFMKSNRSIYLDKNKIESFSEHNSEVIGPGAVETCREKVNQSDRSARDFLRGHFLFSGAHRFATQKARAIRGRCTLSYEAFFALLMVAFEATFSNEHQHFEHYRDAILGSDAIA